LKIIVQAGSSDETAKVVKEIELPAHVTRGCFIHTRLVTPTQTQPSISDILNAWMTRNYYFCVKTTRRRSFVSNSQGNTARPPMNTVTANGVAPELYALETLPGGWFMVVMEYLDDESYQLLLTSSVNRVDLALEVRRVVGVLHAGGFVHGDIRDVNLLVRRKWSDADNPKNVLLVDFDWAGPKEDARYPPNVNHVDMSRPDGARDGELITQEHNQTMVDKMFP
jgi:serine/threonine protein kinase